MSRGTKPRARLGLMLYTVRRSCAADFEGTLGAVGAIGYEGVEIFELHGHAPQEVRAWLDAAGLVACGRHAPLDGIETRLPELAGEAQTVGWRRLVVSWLSPQSIEADADGLRARLGAAAREAARLGVELGLHNHDAEVRHGFLDDLPESLFLELDLGWAWWAGADPVELLERFAGRVPLVHAKDFRARGERSFCPVGDGAVGYERVAPAAVRAGVEWLLVEQDESDGGELDAARRSFEALRRMV